MKSRPRGAALCSGHHPTSRSRNPSDPDVLAQEIADDLQAARLGVATEPLTRGPHGGPDIIAIQNVI